MFEQLAGRVVRIIAREDNDAAIAAVRRGYSRKLAYMRKRDKISLSALHEVFFGDPSELGEPQSHDVNMLIAQDSDTQRSDIFTKATKPQMFWFLVQLQGMVFLNEFG